MIIRPLEKNDVFQHERVASQSFIYDCDVDSENNTLPSDYMLGAFSDDNKTLMADMEIENRISFFGSNRLTCAAVGGVASKPEYRNKGSVRAMFNTLFKDDSVRRNADISFLYPFSAAYYSKFGYESVGRAVELTVPYVEFRNIPKYSDVFLYEGQNEKQFLDLYNKSASRNYLAFERNNLQRFSVDPYKTMEYTYVLNDYSAYVSFRIDRESETVFVKEIEYLNKDALLKITGFLRAFEGNQKYVVFQKLSENSPVMTLFADEKTILKKMFSIGAARILDVESVLAKKDYPMNDGSFSIKCIDDVERNNSVFHVEYLNGKGIVTKRNGDADIILNATAASQILLSGIRDLSIIEYFDGLKINRNNTYFFDAFRFKTCFVNDEF